ERCGKLSRARVSLRRVLCQAAFEDRLHRLGDARAVDGDRRFGNGTGENVGQRSTRVRRVLNEQIVQDAAGSPNVGAGSDRAPSRVDLLGGHERGRAGQMTVSRSIANGNGEAEVRHADLTAVSEQQIARLEVAVNDAAAVGKD